MIPAIITVGAIEAKGSPNWQALQQDSNQTRQLFGLVIALEVIGWQTGRVVAGKRDLEPLALPLGVPNAMRWTRTLSTSIGLALAATIVTARAETPEQLAQTASYIASLQNPDGGFAPSKGEPSTLSATSSSIRILKYVGGSIPDPSACRAYVKSCFDPRTGAFVSEPGGEESSPAITASGLMALAELGIAEPEMVARAAASLGETVNTFPEVRIAVAGLEAVHAKSPKPEEWLGIIKEGRNDDGTWGSGESQALQAGGHAVAWLRMGQELDHKETILKVIREGQREDGGWGEGAKSDLSATYRVMRAFVMLEESPDLEALQAFVGSCRNDDGSYRTSPDAEDQGGTYYATVLLRWIRQLEGLPAILETAGFIPMLQGEGLDGWDGDRELWRVEDGCLIGESPGIGQNEFLVAPGTYQDLVLKFSFRLKEGQGNSGVQFRSERVPDSSEMIGYQADIGENYWGSLYDESRRNRILAEASEGARKAVRPSGWNHYVIRVMGDRITLSLNGVTSVEYREPDAEIPRSGRIGFQIHSGGPMTVEFKEIYIQCLPSPKSNGEATPGFHLRTVQVGDEARKYVVYLPEGYDQSKRYPVVLFLHGAGERGDDGITPAQVGLGPIIAGRPEDFPVIAIFPQARQTWAADSEDARGALAALEEVLKTERGDPDRLILTGLSMGGFGTWQLAGQDPNRWAAIVPICGFNETTKVAKSIAEAGLPVWSFIGDADMPRLLSSTRALLNALRDAGAEPRETEYRSVGHNSWDRAYSDPDLTSWMLQQKRNSAR